MNTKTLFSVNPKQYQGQEKILTIGAFAMLVVWSGVLWLEILNAPYRPITSEIYSVTWLLNKVLLGFLPYWYFTLARRDKVTSANSIGLKLSQVLAAVATVYAIIVIVLKLQGGGHLNFW